VAARPEDPQEEPNAYHQVVLGLGVVGVPLSVTMAPPKSTRQVAVEYGSRRGARRRGGALVGLLPMPAADDREHHHRYHGSSILKGQL